MIKILIADDHKLLREGLRLGFAQKTTMTVIGEAEDGPRAIQLAAKLCPDVVIMDISMPGLNGIEAARHIRSANAKIRIIALSMHLDRRNVTEMLKAGAAGYLLKDCAFDHLVEAIEAVWRGSSYLSPQITRLLLDEYSNRAPGDDFSPADMLSERERIVLQLLSEGKKNREIAVLLGVSMKTVEFYRQQMMEKLNIHSVAELTKFAIREGLTSL